MEKLRGNMMRTSAAYWNGSSNMACAWTTRNAPSEGVRSSYVDRFSAITESRLSQDDMSKPESVSEVKSLLGMAQYVSHHIPDYFTITASAGNQERRAMAVDRPAATNIRQVKRQPNQESRDVVLQPRIQDRSDSRREPCWNWKIVGTGW